MTKTSLNIKQDIIQAGKYLADRGLLPATSGNLSMRLPETQRALITVSGLDKGNLSDQDFIEIDLDGKAINSSKKPSAETLLHTQLYKFSHEIQAVFHVHSINSVVLSKFYGANTELKLSNYELLKALDGVSSHMHKAILPIFRNTQNIELMAAEVEQFLSVSPEIHAYIIEGHGLYSWGKDAQTVIRQIEALDTIFACELKLMAIQKQ